MLLCIIIDTIGSADFGARLKGLCSVLFSGFVVVVLEVRTLCAPIAAVIVSIGRELWSNQVAALASSLVLVAVKLLLLNFPWLGLLVCRLREEKGKRPREMDDWIPESKRTTE